MCLQNNIGLYEQVCYTLYVKFVTLKILVLQGNLQGHDWYTNTYYRDIVDLKPSP